MLEFRTKRRSKCEGPQSFDCSWLTMPFKVGSARGDLFPWKSGHTCRLEPSRSTAEVEPAMELRWLFR